MPRNPYRAQIARQVTTRSSFTDWPERPECDCCGNTFVLRNDGMRPVRVVRSVKGLKKASSTLMCEPCAAARGVMPRPTTTR
jgi:hypothetical protein